VTEVKSGPGFQKANGSSLVAVMRRNGDLARDYAQRHGVPKWYDEAEALIHDPEVDAIYVATPPYAHKEYTLMSAGAGKPVYVEKPMALTFKECQAMIAACESAGVPLWVAYYRRTLPRFLKVKAIIESGELGEIRSVRILHYRPPEVFDPAHIPWRLQPEISGGGIFVDTGSHTLDLLDYFLGPIREVQGLAVNQGHIYPAEDHVVAHFVFENGVLGGGVWCYTADNRIDQMELVGTRGRISFAVLENMPLKLTIGDDEQLLTIDHPAHVQQPLIQSIIDELNGDGHCPSTGVSGSRATWVIDQILGSYRRMSQASSVS
jgi:predicted dehydrogenase